MTAPSRVGRCGDREFRITRRRWGWVITVVDADYLLNDGPLYGERLKVFCRERLRGMSDEDLRHPSLIAAPQFPLLLTVDQVAVRAWPRFVPRDHGAKTFVNQASGRRELATQGPLWMFSAGSRPPTAGGSSNYQQTLGDVEDMAKLWLRSISD